MKSRDISAPIWMELPNESVQASSDTQKNSRLGTHLSEGLIESLIYGFLGLAGVVCIVAAASAMLKLLGTL